MAKKRKTVAEIRAEAKAQERDYLLSAVCRILKHHLGEYTAADRLYKVTKHGTTIDGLAQSDKQLWQIAYSGFDDLRGA